MSRAGIGRAGMAVTIVASLAVAATAHGGESTDLGSANGLNYRAVTTEVQPSTGIDSYAACAAGDLAVGGGVDIVDPEVTPGVPDGAMMGDTHPDVEGDASVWRSSAVNGTGDPLVMTFFAICSESDGVRSKTNKTRIPPGSKAKVRAGCPRGSVVAGGGIQTDGAALASIGYDDADRDERPDDGWKASAYNAGSQPIDLRVHASCVRASAWQLTYTRSGTATQAGHTVFDGSLCAEGRALSGMGAKARGGTGPHDIRLLEIYPVDSGVDGDVTPSEAGVAALGLQNDASDVFAGMSTSTICRG
jgi:hypothetical protein